MRLRFGYVEFTHKYQSSGAGGTRSPLATPTRMRRKKITSQMNGRAKSGTFLYKLTMRDGKTEKATYRGTSCF